MEKIDASAMKARTEAANDRRKTEISSILSLIATEADKGESRAAFPMLYPEQERRLIELGYEISHKTDDRYYIVSWKNAK